MRISLDAAGMIRTFVTSRVNAAGQFDAASQTVRDVPFGAAVTAGTFISFDARLDYGAHTLRLFVNGTDIGSNIPFVDAAATTLADADFSVETLSGATDSGFLDNYRVSIAPVPEPATCGLAAFGAAAVALRRSRARRA